MLYDTVNPEHTSHTSLFCCLKLVVSRQISFQPSKSVRPGLASTKHGTKPRRRWKTAAGLACTIEYWSIMKPWSQHDDPTWPNMTQHSNPQRNPQRKLKVVTDDVDDETWPSEKIQTPNQWHPYIHHVSVLGWVAASTCFWDLLTWQSSLPGSCGM